MELPEYKTIMEYFPPVNPNIDNVYFEAQNTYTQYKALNPLKTPPSGELYSPDIFINLRTLRILLHSNLSIEQFVYELNKLERSWGSGGFYDKSILNPSLVELIHKFTNKIQKQKDIMSESQQIVLDYNIKELENQMNQINFKYKPSHKTSIKDLDMSKLSISKSIAKKKNYKKKYFQE